MNETAYDAFAPVYDALMRDVDYGAWCDYLVSLQKRLGMPEAPKALDVACGTGNLTLRLAAAGWDVAGSDRSPSMLRQAQQKARLAGRPLQWIQQPMQSLCLHRPVDIVNASLDGVNYLLEQQDLSDFMASACRALRPGGWLLFDVSTPYKLEHVLGGQVFAEDCDQAAYFWQNDYDADEALCYMLLTLFVREGDVYRKHVEEHVQRAWTKAQLEQGALQAGFARVKAMDFGGLSPASPSAQRWQFAAQK